MAYLAASLLMCLTFTGRALAKKRAQFLISVINDGPGWRLTIICCNPADIMYNNWVIKHPDGRVINHADALDIMYLYEYMCVFFYLSRYEINLFRARGEKNICSSGNIMCFSGSYYFCYVWSFFKTPALFLRFRDMWLLFWQARIWVFYRFNQEIINPSIRVFWRKELIFLYWCEFDISGNKWCFIKILMNITSWNKKFLKKFLRLE